ncbi:hypothetical protein FHR81_000820 [Actinoalloteichus hoggarensis]|uniref:Uncharacterized protein n=1 Tax=Actinoalloteichus hoggarensis TaxID=1470176 RepID=A0A221W183_9PSEU|nr:hypothetical protein [Actinoalloteichus hoggarensis]ASO19503.1 hypothetical protein AHOG_09295 [Actinoalloteichus hoggarensis]MBB5919791.1 hypothetical protein [Actinoalloteichus hoggarensis]
MTDLDIVAFITQAYGGDLADPDYVFVDRQLEQRPYEMVFREIRELDSVLVEESWTDPNYQVSFGCRITLEERSWALEISMLGPLAVFARTGNRRWERLLYPNEDDLQPVERQIFDVLGKHGITFPSRETLEHRLDMTLWITDPENVRVYHALFSDEDFVPWQFSPLYRRDF